LKKNIIQVFQIAAVFIGTIVGAGLASGKEILEFFTSFGPISFLGILLCGLIYIIITSIICKISTLYKLNSYGELMKTISPNLLGKLTQFITTLYLISSASIILAGSGALISEYFSVPKIVGTLLMLTISSFFLIKGTYGLITVNIFIVPALIFTITLITILYFVIARDAISFANISNYPPRKNGILFSTIIYTGYNLLCSSGVLVPLSTEIKKNKIMIAGITIGSIFLTLLCIMINLLLLGNQPYIYKLEIPLLFVANRFGSIIQALLLLIILLEMFSTEISDVYSISKTLEKNFNINYKRGIFIVLAFALPISQIGFTNLISTLYPIFGLLSLIFIIQCIIFYLKHK
jgi:uncharacterized membrane protein YkvI